ncbi:MAG: hypothetical protein L6R37_006879 [Teloschistes peruensis]|nr:MAG: hypothetical protein L6R37_006879 [Teloschistes peruensis]
MSKGTDIIGIDDNSSYEEYSILEAHGFPAMPSRSNPNVPTKAKRKTASVLKGKRKHSQRLASSKVKKTAVSRTSQALRQNAPLSRKKARKMGKKDGYAKQRQELKKYLESEIEMKDLIGEEVAQEADKVAGQKAEKMEID